ncbi:phospholipid/cholesterol/gamma-HCH transport system ATP-binding protein [Faunimonas pinastri]|uniref:Phospholipid/cholesterol/gamma-HCH transport system ATP-binding protein n=1 Tax=Faunimonas pinastri TaxID=1855383 RepID=A0A1H9FBS3_9HYPH|nr:ATP-binding cassette domain-containing protein [Faunimonas pinastri]SEQ35382.1 phospholipid/cholesterol/gamma-HCH transport system ATP-binding protein [Faunimonas pinastri]
MPLSTSKAPDAEPETILQTSGLTVGFGGRTILENLDFEVRRGEILAIVGASGTGKSVLTRAILGLVPHQAGTVSAFGEEIGPSGPSVEMEKRWGVLFQFGALFSALTVAENVAVPMREFLKLPEDLVQDLSRLRIEMVGLKASDGDKMPSELSGGMIKRAALARALALDPDLLFLDEPTSGLDPISAAGFDQLIVDLRNTLGLTVVMVTHDVDTLHSIVDRIAVIAEKRVLVEGDLNTMKTFDHPWVKEYFQGERARAAFG